MKTIVLTGAGFFLLALGAIGLLLPVWPTTPFVLCAAACFSGTPRLQAKLMALPFFGEHVQNYRSRQGLSRRTVAGSLVFLWGMLLFSCFLAERLWLVLLLLAIGGAVTLHILHMAKPKACPHPCKADSREAKV